ncbi:hypothetical protein Lal_00007428 [Lupinus albus]|uniref:Putative transcription factor C3H family n=1 Tax=Lupinus albus TaxID=3870 RepID=A0A6A4P8I2_LUPAL|nr:putative transcription factor C3H family [Lupinus albus]KAF1874813.1 hypothetical protein Lal_00007428 [Lupinus albus]
MDHTRDSNVVQIITGGENWSSSGSGDQSVWATEDDYRFFNTNNDAESTPKRSRNSQDATPSSSNNRSKAIGKMFFKTKLCCKFRTGTCPYVTNCNFAHSNEELRRPPPNWQEIVAAQEEEKSVPPVEEFQIPSLSGYSGEIQRSYKGRHCKKFYTEEGCPYGDSCTFLHDENSRNRESVAISLGPGGYGGGGGGSGGGAGSGGGGSSSNLKPSNWKTRFCNKWEMTGYCPFGNKCHFAHGAAELSTHGEFVEGESRDTAPAGTPDMKHGGVSSKTPADNVVTSVIPVTHSDIYHIGVPSQRPSVVIQRPGQRTHQKWKGPDKISRIYGDWIDDIE